MKSHASMNRIYRLVFNAALGIWVAVAENARGKGKGGRAASALLAVLAILSPAAYAANAADATLRGGTGTVATVGNTTTINQTSQRMALDWTQLNTAANEALKFNQPNAQAIALNRITGSSPSTFLGNLTANGQVFILNPNGILFGAGSQVNVGGIVASTLGMNPTDFMNGSNTFTKTTGTGSVVNQGSMTAAQGGYLALLAPEVRNEGVMTATLGTALLAAGNKVTLNLNNGSLLSYSIDQGAINALAENKQLIKADGGQVLLSARALDALTTATVNNTGIIEAKTLQNVAGRVMLIGDMEYGTVNAAGSIDISAANGGDGGFAETSAANVKIADGFRVDGRAASGKSGLWLIDPTDITISSSSCTGSNCLSANTIASNLNGGTDVSIATAAAGTGSGHLQVDSTIGWNSANSLSLSAHGNIVLNAGITNAGSGSVTLSNVGALGGVTNLGSQVISVNGGNITLQADGGLMSTASAASLQLNTARIGAGMGGNIAITTRGALQLGAVRTGGGSFSATAPLVVSPPVAVTPGLWTLGQIDTSGNIAGTNATQRSGGHVTVTSNGGGMALGGAIDARAAVVGGMPLSGANGGNVQLQGAVSLLADTTITTNGEAAVFDGQAGRVTLGDVNSAAGGRYSLTINATGTAGGQVTAGQLGNTAALAGLTIQAKGDITVASANTNGVDPGAASTPQTGGTAGDIHLQTQGTLNVGSLSANGGNTTTDSVGTKNTGGAGGAIVLQAGLVRLADGFAIQANGGGGACNAIAGCPGIPGAAGSIAITGPVQLRGSGSLVAAGGLGFGGGTAQTRGAQGNLVINGPVDAEPGAAPNVTVVGKLQLGADWGASQPLRQLQLGGEDFRVTLSSDVLFGPSQVVLASNVRLRATDGVTVLGNINADSAAERRTLDVQGDADGNGTGNVRITGSAGAAQSLGAFTASGDTLAVGGIDTRGFAGTLAQRQGGSVTLTASATGSNAVSLGGNIATQAAAYGGGLVVDAPSGGNVLANAPVLLTSDLTITTHGEAGTIGQGYAGSVTLGAVQAAPGTRPSLVIAANQGNAPSAGQSRVTTGQLGSSSAPLGGVDIRTQGTLATGAIDVRGRNGADEGQFTAATNGDNGGAVQLRASQISINGGVNADGGRGGADQGTFGPSTSGSGGSMVLQGAATMGGAWSLQGAAGSDSTGLPTGGGMGGAVNVQGPLTVSVPSATINTLGGVGGAGRAGSGAIALGAVDSASGSQNSLGLTGAIALQGNWGTAQSLGAVRLEGAVQVAGNSAIKADTITLVAGTALNADAAASQRSLSLEATQVALGGTLGASQRLGSLSITAGTGISNGAGGAIAVDATQLNLRNTTSGDVLANNTGNITVTGNSNVGRMQLASSTGDITLNGTVNASAAGDAIVLAVNKKLVNNAGSAALTVTNGGRWLVWSQTPVSNIFGGLQSGNTAMWNTAFNPASPTVGGAANQFIFSDAGPGVGVVKANNASKTYGDAFAGSFGYTAVVAGGEDFGNAFTDARGAAIALGGTALVLGSTGAAATATRTGGNSGGAGYDINVDITGATAAGYTLQAAKGTLTVDARAINISGGRVYDGTTDVAGGALLAGNTRNGDTITLTGAGSMADKHAGNGKALGLGTLALDGSAAANYTLAGGTAAVDITRANLSLTTNAVTKTYDGGLTAAGTAVATGGTQLFGTDAISGGTFAFTDKNFGLGNKTVTASGVTVNDGSGGNNYNVSYVNNTDSTINKAALTVTANNDSKVAGSPAYSGGNGVSTSGLATGDALASVLTGAPSYSGTAQGATAVGSYVITPGGLTLASNNYTLGYANGLLNITALPPKVVAPVSAVVSALGEFATVRLGFSPIDGYSSAQNSFQTSFKTDIAAALNIDVTRINIQSLNATANDE